MSQQWRCAWCCPLFLIAAAQIAPITNMYYTVPGLDGTANGQGTADVAAVSISHNVGYIQFEGRNYRVLTYKPQFSFGGYDLMDGLAVREDGGDVALFYLYCQGGTLASVYQESYFASHHQLPASGTCSPVRSSVQSQAYFPAITALPSGINPGFSINGGGISLSGGRGYIIARDGIQRRWTTFGKVDCSTCPGGPWWEVHGIFDNAPNNACFGILYLRASDYNSVQLGWSICMPSLTNVDKVFSASWRPDSELAEPGFNPMDTGLPWRPAPSMEKISNITSGQTTILA